MRIAPIAPMEVSPTQIQPVKTFYRPDEVAKFFCVTRKCVYGWIEQGKLGAIKVGGVVRIPATAVESIQKSWFD